MSQLRRADPPPDEPHGLVATAATFFSAFFVSLALLATPTARSSSTSTSRGEALLPLARGAVLRPAGPLAPPPIPPRPLGNPRLVSAVLPSRRPSMHEPSVFDDAPHASSADRPAAELPDPAPLQEQIVEVLRDLGCPPPAFEAGPGRRSFTLQVPVWLNLSFLRNRIGLRCGTNPHELNATVERKGLVERLVVAPVAVAPWSFHVVKDRAASRVALIVDDVGFHAPCIDEIVGLACPMTLSIFPFYPSSVRAARLGRNSGLEIMLHMPMEPKGSLKNFQMDSGILARLADGEIRRRLEAAIEAVPHCIGMNNHMGSLATEDRRIMRLTMESLKRRDMFFVDSVTSLETLGYATAKSLGVRSALRNAKFLDNSSAPRALSRAFARLRGTSRRQPETLAILHDRRNSILALREALDGFRKDGVEFCFASELAR